MGPRRAHVDVSMATALEFLLFRKTFLEECLELAKPK